MQMGLWQNICLDETESYDIQIKKSNYILNTPNQTGAYSPVLYIGGGEDVTDHNLI